MMENKRATDIRSEEMESILKGGRCHKCGHLMALHYTMGPCEDTHCDVAECECDG